MKALLALLLSSATVLGAQERPMTRSELEEIGLVPKGHTVAQDFPNDEDIFNLDDEVKAPEPKAVKANPSSPKVRKLLPFCKKKLGKCEPLKVNACFCKPL
jgi:hypothetical protein